MSRCYDVVILGGGVVGVLAGIALSKRGLSVALIERRDSILSNLDDRVFALSKKSKDILSDLGIWPLLHKYASIDHIMIYDSDSSSYVHYDEQLVAHTSMGYIVSGLELSKILREKSAFEVLTSCSYEYFEVRDGFHEISLSNGNLLKARLVVCAEGKNSSFRDMSSVKTLRYDCGQSCITCNIEHDKPHNNVAVEHFFASGPFAILPMWGGYKSSIVWTENSQVADCIHDLPKAEFLDLLRRKCNHHIGTILDVNSPVHVYKIDIMFPVKQCGKRFLLIGDSSHSIHPVAGQGLNLGIRDIAAMAQVLGHFHALGSDIGQDFVLKEIENNRVLDNFSMAVTTTGINRIFSSKSCALKILRRTAMSIVEMSPTLKTTLMKSAMGMNRVICGNT